MKEPKKEAKVNKKDDIDISDLITEFAESDSQMGRINNLYMKWADYKGADCAECRGMSF